MNVVCLPTTAQRSFGDDRPDDGRKQSKQQEPRIRFLDLAAHGFNVAESMGRLLKEQNRVSFECLMDIKTAYLDAFRLTEDKKHRPSEPLVQLFDRFFADLKTLESIRNLLAHRGGVVDNKFLDELRTWSPSLADLPIGQPLSVDGDMVSKFLGSVAEASVCLLNFVADWLAKRPE